MMALFVCLPKAFAGMITRPIGIIDHLNRRDDVLSIDDDLFNRHDDCLCRHDVATIRQARPASQLTRASQICAFRLGFSGKRLRKSDYRKKLSDVREQSLMVTGLLRPVPSGHGCSSTRTNTLRRRELSGSFLGIRSSQLSMNITDCPSIPP
jgi:hypothetical protein